jgi:hypothetical protein
VKQGWKISIRNTILLLNIPISRIQHSQLEEMEIEDLISMLIETTELDEQASIVHYLWLKLGPNYDTRLTSVPGVTVKLLLEVLIFICYEYF